MNRRAFLLGSTVVLAGVAIPALGCSVPIVDPAAVPMTATEVAELHAAWRRIAVELAERVINPAVLVDEHGRIIGQMLGDQEALDDHIEVGVRLGIPAAIEVSEAYPAGV